MDKIDNNQEYSITVRDLKVRYKSVSSYSIKKNLLRMKGAETKAFEAVRGVSFDVRQGEILGITGKNGSGKSTLLRAIAGIFSADEGTVDLHGHSISLLAIGVGFKSELTGRENIMLSGLLLGFSEAQVKERYACPHLLQWYAFQTGLFHHGCYGNRHHADRRGAERR